MLNEIIQSMKCLPEIKIRLANRHITHTTHKQTKKNWHINSVYGYGLYVMKFNKIKKIKIVQRKILGLLWMTNS